MQKYSICLMTSVAADNALSVIETVLAQRNGVEASSFFPGAVSHQATTAQLAKVEPRVVAGNAVQAAVRHFIVLIW